MKISHKLLRLMLTGLLLLLWGIVGVGCSEPPETPTGMTVRVERVVSGQTIEIVSPTENIPRLQRVRLIGINAPDLRQDPWGMEAKRRLQQLCQGQQVLLELDQMESDRYDRLLAYIWRDEILVNEELVKQGYALAEAGIYNNKYSQRLDNAQRWARIMGLGIWNPEQPMRFTPAEFRQQQS
ncbi:MULTISPECIES: thermonuclease family protein [Arthrospira]|uniref:thermonuclease family protein n=1 Tax=Limnospira TaxID=2596745 RepID=UPI000F806BFA|nr:MULTISPECIES: thermonuclease family protein [Arthrospira]MBD2670583.1 thermonuclease family protein [Arthrospira platensis FACHB-439]MBD2711239.1 thermonuclease family protein [Arthrospira platensis FACHB-835]MDT9183652.1 thermonuclease family protein [Limnospira sp. PMC 289.06]MDT9294196.1 thermonuclease family protein [Arthrospira platensis PCC 7345]MDT9311534.1 thermonuclease family protein [Limnospira sp. Paracas R14]QQW31232.1 thermonuclease family protein [Arthrospira sp. PCC 9108]